MNYYHSYNGSHCHRTCPECAAYRGVMRASNAAARNKDTKALNHLYYILCRDQLVTGLFFGFVFGGLTALLYFLLPSLYAFWGSALLLTAIALNSAYKGYKGLRGL